MYFDVLQCTNVLNYNSKCTTHRDECLDEMGRLEQELIFGEASGKEMIALLQQHEDKFQDLDKLRLLCIYSCIYQVRSSSHFLSGSISHAPVTLSPQSLQQSLSMEIDNDFLEPFVCNQIHIQTFIKKRIEE